MPPAKSPSHDPRSLAPAPAEEGVAPTVALPRQGLPRWVLIGFAMLAAVILFAILEARRQSVSTPAETAPEGTAVTAQAPPPPLYVPVPVQPQPQRMLPPQPISVPGPPQVQRMQPPAPRAPTTPQIVYVPQPPQGQPQAAAPAVRIAAEPALVVDTTGGPAAEAQTAAAAGQGADPDEGSPILGARARAGVLANRSTTVPQGTLIPAVMETAFNSTQPGLARAIVSQDVRGFDGTRVLIPRGSRLVGEYRSDAAPGQRRALVNWVRLIRPDGVTIAIGSPATDPLGRGGIRANVNSHFFQRFAAALLRSTIDVGLTVAAGAANAPVVLLPGNLGGGVSDAVPRDITPTLSVRQGASISIFVARDLDFTGVERRR